MIRSIFYPGLLAGILAGLFIFGAQQVKIVPMVFEAESYEGRAAGGHGHGAAQAAPRSGSHEDGAGHSHGDSHGDDEWSPADGLERTAFSLFSNLITAIGFGLALSAAFVLSRRRVSWREGIIWGLAGFAAVHLAPAFGLPPELPGMAAEEDLIARQTWAMATTVLTAGGLALLFLGKRMLWRIAGALLIAAPHFVQIERVHVEHAVPVELVSQFIVATLVVTALFWMLLGALTSYFSGRVGQARA